MAGLDLLEIGLEFRFRRAPVDAQLLHQRLGRGRVPVRLDDLERMGAADQRRELAVCQNGQVVVLAGGLADPLVLVQRRDAAGVVADHHVGPRLFHRDLDLAVDGEGAGELAFGNDVAEAETAAVVPGRIVDHLGAQRIHDTGRDGNPVSFQDIVVVDRVFRHHLVDMAGRMDGCADAAGVDGLARRDPVAHDMQPFRIVHDLFRDQQLAVDQPVEFAEDLLHPVAQLGRVQQILAHFLVVAERRAAMDQRIIVGVGQALRPGADIGLVEVAQEDRGQALEIADARAVIVPGGAGSLVGLVEIFRAELIPCRTGSSAKAARPGSPGCCRTGRRICGARAASSESAWSSRRAS